MQIIEVKEITDDIYAGMTRLLPQLSADCKIPSRAELAEMAANPNIFLFVLVDDAIGMAGTLTLARYRIPTTVKYWIEDVVVDAATRGKGYGKLLTKHALEYAKLQGATAVELTSRPARVEANQLYQRLGFEQRETNVYKYIF